MDERYAYRVQFDVTNTGSIQADEVSQLYIRDVQSSIVTPHKLLQGFKRISLAPSETQTIEILLDFDSFKLLDRTFKWIVESGEFMIMVGSASADIRLEQSLHIY